MSSFFPQSQSVLPPLTLCFSPLIHPVLCPVTCRYILPANMHPVLSLIASKTHKNGPVKIISPFPPIL